MAAAIALLIIPQGAPAHSPTDLQLAFNRGDRILSVTITHPVADPSTHYIKRVLITSGGSTIADTAYSSQPSPQTFTYTYLMPQSVNGEVQVKGECSILGSMTRSIQVQAASPGTTGIPGTSPPTSATTPAGAEPAPLLLTAAIALAAWRFRG
jgi:hypothetical protein